jgi:hypothetical protein
MSGERRQPTRSSYDDPRRADRRTRTAARRIWLTLEDCALARRLTGDRRFREQQQPAAGSGSSRNISRRRRSAFCPPSAVIVFDTFSFPPTIPIFSYSTYEYGKVSHADCIVY